MIAINHALTGALIGFTVSQPLIALPLAIVSHFVLDALPHYGDDKAAEELIVKKRFSGQLLLDAGACFILVVLLAIFSNPGWVVAALCAFVATLPDFAWLPGYLRVKRGGDFRTATPNRFMRFSKYIQWFERPIGAYVEIAWFIGASVLLIAYL